MLSVYISNTKAAECHVLVVKLSMEFNKRKGECNNKITSVFYTMMLLLGFSVRFLLRLLLLRRLQPGEPLVYLRASSNRVQLKPFLLFMKMLSRSQQTKSK